MRARHCQFSIVPHAAAVASVLGVPMFAWAQGGGPPPPPPPPPIPAVVAPANNQPTEAKRVLGKILFMDEQLSVDNTMACVTCHIISRGGSDPRRARNPGADNIFNTGDDKLASPGVASGDALHNYVRDAVFGTAPQVTNRATPTMINAALSPRLFWDGRATPRFVDPQTGTEVSAANAALESQAVQPIVDDTEMAHIGTTWPAVLSKLSASRPLAMAQNLPPDLSSAITARPTWGALFEAAFGDRRIDAVRIAQALATYQRTLISNQAPFDAFIAGNPNALTAGQRAGWAAFVGSNCNVCHGGGLLSDNTFRNVGLRPFAEDVGRQAVTGNINDRGRFKVPNLRNVGLKNNFFHNGIAGTLADVVNFYARTPGPGTLPQFTVNNNQDPVMANVNVPQNAIPGLLDFLSNALTDPRVRNGIFPFDSVTLAQQLPAGTAGARPLIIGTGQIGLGGFTPAIVATMPGLIGSSDFRIALDGARPNTQARLVRSSTPPVAGRLPLPEAGTLTFPTGGTSAGTGLVTAHLSIPADAALIGTIEYFQWFVTDAAAADGFATSAVARVTYFCGNGGCAPVCLTDIVGGDGNAPGDGAVDGNDFMAFLNAFAAEQNLADLVGADGNPPADGSVDGNDFVYFLNGFGAGC